MPPAFNLSQDQTLQFDLVCLGSVFLPKFPRLVLPRALRIFPSVRLSQHCPRLASDQDSALAVERPRFSAFFLGKLLLSATVSTTACVFANCSVALVLSPAKTAFSTFLTAVRYLERREVFAALILMS